MTKKTIISLIAAMSKNRVIGLNNALPWSPIPADWDNLKEVTKNKKMIMGRKSYDNPHRIWSEEGNYVITRQTDYIVDEGFEVVGSLEEAFDYSCLVFDASNSPYRIASWRQQCLAEGIPFIDCSEKGQELPAASQRKNFVSSK
jgi:hypothetical protein